MACGTPALGFAVAGARDALADGELGATVSENELVPAMLHLLKQPNSASGMLATTVQERFGRATFAKRLQSSLQLALADSDDTVRGLDSSWPGHLCTFHRLFRRKIQPCVVGLAPPAPSDADVLP